MSETPTPDPKILHVDGLTPTWLIKLLAGVLGLMRKGCGALSVRRRRVRDRSTLDWGRAYLSNHFAKPPSALHQWLGEQLDRARKERGLKINLVGPRGAAKSTIGTLSYVLQMAVTGAEPYIWIVSDTKQQADTHLENIKAELLENQRLARDYPHAAGRGSRWQASVIQLPNDVVIESFGTGQAMRGRRVREHRPTLIICDDLQNDGHIASAAQRESSRSWFEGTLLKAGTKDTNIIHVATALHREALAVVLLTAPGWISKRFASIERWPKNMDLWGEWQKQYTSVSEPDAADYAQLFYDDHRAAMDEGAQVLWPEEEDLYTLMRMRVESGPASFEREKQGSPVDPESCEFPPEYFNEDTMWFTSWPENLVVRAIALDPSKGTGSRRGDFSAYVLVGIDERGVFYVEADLARRPTPQMVADGAAHCRRFQPTTFGVEANQFQELLSDEIAAEFARQQISFVVPAAIHNYNNKQMRIRRIGPYLSQRRLRFLAGCASTKVLVEQLRDFPLAAHDDGPDALEMAIRLAEDVQRNRNANDGLGSQLIREP
jgi:predicted phage terminase large subunit-like protein